MMTSAHLMRIGKIKGNGRVLAAAKHNKRNTQHERKGTQHIDFTRSSLNYALVGDTSPKDIADHAKSQMKKAGIEKPRANAVLAIEIISAFQLSGTVETQGNSLLIAVIGLAITFLANY